MGSFSDATTTRRGASWLLVLLALGAGLLLPRAAQAEEPLRPVVTNCTGWAIPGAVVGAFGGSLFAMGTLKLAGEDWNAPRSQTRDSWIIGTTILLGVSAGPILSCKLFDREPYPIPKATFVLAGMSVGAVGTGAGWFALAAAREKNRGGTAADKFSRGEGASGLGALLLIVGGLAGGAGGYYLHEALFNRGSSRKVSARIEALSAPGGAGVQVSGTF
jgi:hypothetical protein